MKMGYRTLVRQVSKVERNLCIAVWLLPGALKVSMYWYTSPSRDRLSVLKVGVLNIFVVSQASCLNFIFLSDDAGGFF